MKSKAIIVDIDGTLANNEHRRHFVESDPKNWKAFNEEMEQDTVHEWCAQLVFSVFLKMDWKIIYVTGRHQEYSKITNAFLLDAGVPVTEVFMRADGDYRADHVVKLEIYKRDIEPKYDIQFCIDDRKQVVDMWRAQGLVCLQCAEGNF